MFILVLVLVKIRWATVSGDSDLTFGIFLTWSKKYSLNLHDICIISENFFHQNQSNCF